jgi:hypothetical protein
MKNNTQNIKLSLQNILIRMPQDFALQEVRHHIKAAISMIENIEKKRERREIKAERKEQSRTLENAYFYDPLKAIKAIEEEISREKTNLENIQRRREKQKDDDNEEFQTVFG